MRGAAVDAIVKQERLEKLRPGGFEVLVRAGRALAVRKLAGADLRFDLVLVENALLLVAGGLFVLPGAEPGTVPAPGRNRVTALPTDSTVPASSIPRILPFLTPMTHPMINGKPLNL